MLIRTGHRPEDWRDEGPAAPAPGRDWFHGGSSLREPAWPDLRPDKPDRPKDRAALKSCELTARCRHRPCVELRVAEAKRLHMTTDLSLGQIGIRLGGRDHSTVSYWLHEYQAKVS